MEPVPPEEGEFSQLHESHSPLRRALWVTLVYLLVGLVWITFSDRIVEVWFPDARTLSEIQTWKGLLFVAVTGLALFLVDRKSTRLNSSHVKISYAVFCLKKKSSTVY